jgi:NTE family protein
MAKKIKVGLALGSGGARGLAHIGVLKALEEQKIPIDLIVGTSMGAIIGGIYAQEPDAKRLEQLVKKYVCHNDFQEGWIGFFKDKFNRQKANLLNELTHFVRKKYVTYLSTRKLSLETSERLLNPLKELLREEPIEKTKIKFATVAIDLTTGTEVILQEGSILDAVYASSAIQGVFPPLVVNNKLLVDGGPTSGVPIDVTRKLGADFVIAVNVPQMPRRENEFKSGLEVILRSDWAAQAKLNQLHLSFADLIITPQVRSIHWANFGKVDECIQKGYQAAIKKTDEIKDKLTRRKSFWRNFRKTLAQSIAGA